MSANANKAIVQRYFTEMIDKRSDHLLDELWSDDCVVHRPEVDVKGREAYRQAFNRAIALYSDFQTSIQNIITENDLVVCRLSHKVTHRNGQWPSRLGRHAVTAGQVITWSAIAMFRIRDGKIAEEWVCRDELGMLIQLGVVAPSK